MNNKYLAVILVVIIIFASALGYLAYSGAFSSNSNPSPTPTPTPTTTASPTPTITPTPSATPMSTASPTPTQSASPTPSLSPSPTPTPQPVDLRVFIASSLTNIVANMTQAFDTANNCNIIVNPGSSSALYTQITSGSPCDVFMSADTKWTNQLNSTGLTLNNAVKFTNNSLCVIVAQGKPKNIQTLADLTKPGVKIVIADPSVPVGSYTNQTLTKITSTWGNSSSPQYDSSGAYVNYYTNFQANVVNKLGTDEQVVGAVSLNMGTADAGIVFYSDWAYANMTGSQVQFIAIPSAVNTVGNYGIVVPNETTQAALAQKFMDYWSTQNGQKLLAEFGFGAA